MPQRLRTHLEPGGPDCGRHIKAPFFLFCRRDLPEAGQTKMAVAYILCFVEAKPLTLEFTLPVAAAGSTGLPVPGDRNPGDYF